MKSAEIGVGELGEQDDHRAPRQARRKRRQRERVVGLVARYSRSARRAAASSGKAPPPETSPLASRGRELKALSATRSPSLSAIQAVSSIAETHAVDPRQRRRPARTSAARYRSRTRSGCCARSDIAWRAASGAAPTASSRSRGGPCRCGNRPGCRSPSPRRASSCAIRPSSA